MYGIKSFSNRFGQIHHFHGNRGKPGSFISLNNVAHNPFFNGIRFNNR